MSPKSEKGSGEVGSTVGNTGNPDSKAVKFNGQLVQENQTEIGFGEWMVVSRRRQ